MARLEYSIDGGASWQAIAGTMLRIPPSELTVEVRIAPIPAAVSMTPLCVSWSAPPE